MVGVRTHFVVVSPFLNTTRGESLASCTVNIYLKLDRLSCIAAEIGWLMLCPLERLHDIYLIPVLPVARGIAVHQSGSGAYSIRSALGCTDSQVWLDS